LFVRLSSPRTVSCLSVLVLLTSCSDDRTVGPPAAGEVGAACQEDGECNSSWCLKESSFPDNYCSKDCSADPTCPDKSTCHAYSTFKFCMRDCASDGDCRQGYVCDYNVCLPPCSADKFCKQGDTCFNGRCKAKCSTNDDCGGDLRCQDGKCVAPCKTDGDCLPGFTCDTAAGNCKPKPGKPMGEPCGADKDCATGYCLPGHKICSVKCTSSKQCPSAYACGPDIYDKDFNGTDDSVVTACVPAKGSKIAGEACAKDADCASEHCYYGLCMEGCAVDSDCAASQQCVTVNLLLKGAVPHYNGCLPRVATTDYTIGTFTGITAPMGFDVPPTAASVIIATQVPSLTEMGVVGQLTDPKGSILTGSAKDICGYYSEPNRYHYDVQYSSLYVPNAPTVSLQPGIYTYSVGATQPSLPVTVKLKMKIGKAQKGTLNINWYFANLSGTCIPGATLNAQSAPSHAWFNKIRNNLGSILTQAGLKLGSHTYHDVKDSALDVIDLPDTGVGVELQKLFAKSQGQQGSSVNAFFVRNIKGGGFMGGIVLGIAGGIPGPAGDHGTVHSGLAMSMQTACFEQYGYNPAHTLAHEFGHYFGLSHNLENTTVPGFQDNKVICPCPCGANMVCVSQTSGTKWCRGMDPIPDTDTSVDNLMYFAAESTQNFKGNKLTPSQVRVILDNPVVGHQ